MQLHQLQPKNKRKSRKRVGRGGKKGTYVGRGLKGQKSRAGAKTRPGFAGGDTTFIKRLPKQRGVIGKRKMRKGVKLSRYQIKPVVLNLEQINKNFKDGEIVSPKTLFKKGLIERTKTQRVPDVKILGKGKLIKKVEFKNVHFSKNIAKLKIIKLNSKFKAPNSK